MSSPSPPQPHQSPPATRLATPEPPQSVTASPKRKADWEPGRVEHIRKKVAGGLIDKHWDPLDHESKAIFNRMMATSVNRTLEKFTPGKKSEDVRIRETQKVLVDYWLGHNSTRSFSARLDVTSFPPTSTMRHSALKDDGPINFLNQDVLLRRKKYLETYLAAELKQLHELEAHHRRVEAAYRLDLKYLNEFKKTTHIESQQMKKDLASKASALGLDKVPQTSEVRLVEPPTSDFDPLLDPDTRQVVESLDSTLTWFASRTDTLKVVNDKFEQLYNAL